MAKMEKKKLGEILVEKGVITSAQLTQVLAEQKRTGERLGRILVNLGFITERELIKFLGAQMDIPPINLDNYLIDPQIIDLVPQSLARRYILIPVFKSEDTLTLAMADPLNVFAIDDLHVRTKCRITPAVASETDILRAIDQYYGISESMEEVIKEASEEKFKLEEVEEVDLDKIEALAEEMPIIKLVNLIIMQAVKDRASDIHIESERDKVRTRYRIDGVLYEVPSPPKRLQPAIVSRIKIMSGMDIAEKRLPQDGRIMLRARNKDIDLRVATLPTMFGEKVVLRILERAVTIVDLDKLGLLPETRKRYEEIISRPYGIVLSTGPTGCGKSSTLYASLNKIKSTKTNIITIEDPIEYQISLVNQVQINPKAGLTFANGLRSFLRQDPDIIMVGEIRDLETAEIAVHASLTGHLVLSTLHTNDAPTAFTRLIDMGVEPFLVSSSVTAVMAQRLVRTICPKCREEHQPPKEVLEELGLSKEKGLKFYRGKGCGNCKNTGYFGRTGIFELLIPNEKIKDIVVRKTPATEIRKEALRAGMRSLREDGVFKIKEGITSIEEVLRVTQEEEFKITA
ncbi:type II secretion system ATPase GspE [bacterium]|nr:type II secretion system ATPase GspE [bacterium]MCG2678335.1 type II secretion system ATPase GspE [bacterium]